MQWLDPSFIATRIQSLDSVRFADLVNDVLTETAARNRIDRACIVTNLRTTEPDGGIDARCVNSPRVVGQLIPRSAVDYQFKSGRETKTTDLIARDDIFAKPRVIAGLEDGHAFVYIAAWDRGDRASEDLLVNLRDKGVSVEDGQVIFLGLDSLSRLLRTFPALIAKYLGAGSNLDSFDDWSRYRTLSNPFTSDDALRDRVASLRSTVKDENSILRVTGAPGEGKTRLVLEALRSSGLESSVLYAQQAEGVSADLISYLKRTADVRCTIVIDEVDDDAAERLTDRFSFCQSAEVRVILIGLDAQERTRPGTFRVPKPSQAVLFSAIKAIVPTLPDDETQAIASDCERSPKLAVLIANRIQEDPSLVNARNFLADGNIRSMLDRYLPLEGEAWKALRALAIFTRLGWTGSVESESETVFPVLGLDAIVARRSIEELHERYGVAPIGGRYRYVSPAVLADYLAAKEIEPWTRTHINSVFGAMTPEMQDSFGRRLRRCSAVLRNRTIIEEVILGDQGPFRRLEDLESNLARTLLRRLAVPFSQATLRVLSRLILGATSEELTAAKASRRDIVWALQELLWREDTFQTAAHLTLRLAVTENESWANNATALWTGMFQTVLGGTAAGLETRLRVLRQAVTSSNSKERQLAAKALKKALLASDMMVGQDVPPSNVEGMPQKAWEPATYGDWVNAFVAYLNLLQPLLQDANEAVRIEAGDDLQTALSSTFHLPPKAFDAWLSLASKQTNLDRVVQLGLIRAIEFACGRCDFFASGEDDHYRDLEENKPTESEQEQRRDFFNARRAKLQELASRLTQDDFSLRFRLAVTRRERVFRQDYYEAEQEIEKALEPFALEAITAPTLLESEWSWLLEESNFHWSIRWIQILGRMDTERRFKPVLERIAKENTNAVMWRSLYELSYAQHQNDASYIDHCLEDMMTAGDSGIQVFDLAFRAGYAPSRIRYIERLLETGQIEPSVLAHLAYHPWGPALPPQEVITLITAVLQRGTHLTTTLPFLDTYLSQATAAIPAFEQLVVPILLSAESIELSGQGVDSWMKLARRYVDKAPIQMTSIALNLYSHNHRNALHENGISELLHRAWQNSDRQQFFETILAPWIDSDDMEAWRIRNELPGWAANELPLEYLINWVAEKPEKRAYRVASIIGAPGNPPSDLQIELLSRFDEFGVGEAFYSDYVSGSFWGSISGWTRGLLENAKRWQADPHPVVREWASKIIGDLEGRLEQAIAYEDEERLE
jgi:hypothetical protein